MIKSWLYSKHLTRLQQSVRLDDRSSCNFLSLVSILGQVHADGGHVSEGRSEGGIVL